MPIASGLAKKVIFAPVATQGTLPIVGLSTAQYLRRVTSDLNLTKETYSSNEIRSDMQVGDFRHGVRFCEGTIAGELSPGTYSNSFKGILRQDWQTPSTTGAIITVTAASTTGASGTFTRSAGSYLTDGFKIGDVVRWSGWATTATANNAHNFLITSLTALIMTGTMLDGVAVAAKAAGDSVTGVTVGKKTYIPTTGHVSYWWAVEHFYSDISLSELYTDCKINTLSVKLPATGMATIDIGLQGLKMHPTTAAYFTSPIAASTAGTLAAVNGALYVGTTKVALLTSLDFDISANLTSEPVVGSNEKPTIFDGKITVQGNMSVFFEDATFRDYFINETEVSVLAVFTTANTPAADFMAFTFPRIKVGGATKDDGDKGLIQSMPFTALYNTAGGTGVSSTATTFVVQDSTIV